MAIFLISMPLAILGASTEMSAQYVQEPNLMFKTGGDGDPYQNTQLIGLLGTITLTFNNSPITVKQPSLVDSTTSINFWFEGMFDWNPTNVDTTWEMVSTEFYWDTALYINGSLFEVRRQSETEGFAKLTSNSATIPNVSSLVVKIYLRAHHSSDKFKPGANFTLKSGTIGTFNFAVAPPNANINTTKDYVPVNDQVIIDDNTPPPNPIPIVGSGGSTTTIPSVPYVNDDPPPQGVQCLLSIINEQVIDLPEAYGIKMTDVAKARVEIRKKNNGKKKYKLDIKFESNSVAQGKFHLHLDGDLNQYGIPYYLYFKHDTVVPGTNIPWEVTAEAEEVIKVTGVIQDDAERAPAGSYHDTITVTITAVD